MFRLPNVIQSNLKLIQDKSHEFLLVHSEHNDQRPNYLNGAFVSRHYLILDFF